MLLVTDLSGRPEDPALEREIANAL